MGSVLGSMITAGLPSTPDWACGGGVSISDTASASMTLRVDFVRSWLRSRRTVSRFESTSSVPPATNPTTSTRWNGDVSSFGWMGVSIGVS